jgi:hypothetical protein
MKPCIKVFTHKLKNSILVNIKETKHLNREMMILQI